MCADYGFKSPVDVEKRYTLSAPKINHGCRKALRSAIDVENGMI
jgi:hypothetical protein